MAYIILGYAALFVGFVGCVLNLRERQIGAGLFLLFAGAITSLSCVILAEVSK